MRRKKLEKTPFVPTFRGIFIDPSRNYLNMVDYQEDTRGEPYTVLKVLGEPGEFHTKLENGDILYVTGAGMKEEGDKVFVIPYVTMPIYGKAVIVRFSNMHITRRGKCNTSIVKLRKEIKFMSAQEVQDRKDDDRPQMQY